MDSKHGKILIVDDDIVSIEYLRSIMENSFDCYIAKNGREALIVLEKIDIDLILLDIVMPDDSGYKVILQIQELATLSLIPVIFVTGLSGIDAQEQGLLLGAFDYFIKPIDPKIAIAKAKRIVEYSLKVKEAVQQNRTDSLTGMIKSIAWQSEVSRVQKILHNKYNLCSLFVVVLEGEISFKVEYGFMYFNFVVKKAAEGIMKIFEHYKDCEGLCCRYGEACFTFAVWFNDKELLNNIEWSLQNLNNEISTYGLKAYVAREDMEQQWFEQLNDDMVEKVYQKISIK